MGAGRRRPVALGGGGGLAMRQVGDGEGLAILVVARGFKFCLLEGDLKSNRCDTE